MPLLFDMPIEDLRNYKGTNPRPDNFDEFWDSSLEEMHNIDPNIELVESNFNVPHADCHDLYFTGVKNARIHAKLLRPKNANKPAPAVLMFHGYSGDAGDWWDKLAFVAMGYTVAALDCRGQGGESEDTGGVLGTTLHGHIIRGLDGSPDNLLFRHIFLDTAQLAKIVMDLPQVEKTRVGVHGGSQGGGLSLACAALEPRISRVAPVIPFLSDYKRTWSIDLAKDAYAELKEYFRFHDPLHEREDDVFKKLGYIDIQYLCPRIRGEVFMGVGLMDTICPPSTQFAAYNRITSKKSLALYPDFGHEAMPGHSDKVYEFLSKL